MCRLCVRNDVDGDDDSDDDLSCQLVPTSVDSAELDWRGGAGDDNVGDDDVPTGPHICGICRAGLERWCRR